MKTRIHSGRNDVKNFIKLSPYLKSKHSRIVFDSIKPSDNMNSIQLSRC